MAEANRLFSRFAEERSAGTVLFREGEDGDTMYVVQQGRVSLTKETSYGPRVVSMVGPGEFLGELALLSGRPRGVTATVIEDARLLVFDAETFGSMVVGSREIAVRLIRRLAEQLEAAEGFIEILLQRDPQARVILALEREVELSGSRKEDGSVLIPVSSENLARQVGLEPSQVTAVAARLSRLNLANPTPDGFVIPDVSRLHEFLQFVRDRRTASWN